jgi:transketolase
MAVLQLGEDPNVIESDNTVNNISFVRQDEFKRLHNSNASSVEQAELFATMCRINTLYMIAKAGSGHIGTSFSCLDILSWLYLNEIDSESDDQQDNIYFSSKGHDAPALYSVLTALGKLDFDLIHRLRRIDGLPGHPDVGTDHIVTNTGSLGMGVSKAKGMVFANQLNDISKSIYVLTGDGELQEGQFWESLVSAANNNIHEITVIVDHNKIQSDTWVTDVSDHGDLDAKFAAFGWHVERCDGNNIGEFSAAIERTKAVTNKPKVIIADTVKGCGVDFMEGPATPEGSLYQFHSGAASAKDYTRAVDGLTNKLKEQCEKLELETAELSSEDAPVRVTLVSPQKLVGAYADALLELGGKHRNIVSLDADLVLDTGQIPFRDAYPDRFVECGIAEQDMVSQAGGMALNGLLPIVHSFSCFLTTRPNEQIYNNATEHTKIIYVGSLSGVVPGGPGHSHQSVRDIAAMSGMPGLTLIEPCCETEVAAAMNWAVSENQGSSYLRLVSIPCEIPYSYPIGQPLVEGIGNQLAAGDDILVIGYGPVLLPQAIHAADKLREEHNVSVRVVNLPWLNRIDHSWLHDAATGVRHIVTLDNHYIEGGQGQLISAALSTLDLPALLSITNLGLTEVPACGTNDEVLAYHKLDAEGIYNKILEVSQL